jgi:hypothetical protein
MKDRNAAFLLGAYFRPEAVARMCHPINATELPQGVQTMFTMDMPNASVAQVQQMIMVAQAAMPKTAAQVDKTIWRGGLFVG